MTAETESASLLIRDLAAAIVAHPEDLRVASQDSLDGATYFALRGNAKDDPILIGREGTHVDSLAFLVWRFGEAAGASWTFRLITDEGRRERAARTHRDVLSYDPEPARALLDRLLAALEVEPRRVSVGPGTGVRENMLFVYEIWTPDWSDLSRLRRHVVRPATETAPEQAIEMSDIDAIGTLFRAAAKRDGVRFQVTIVKP